MRASMTGLAAAVALAAAGSSALAQPAAPPLRAADLDARAAGALQAKDYVAALGFYRQAAGLGDANAEFQLAMMAAQGFSGPADYAEAARWMRAAADQGMPIAESDLGIMYVEGRGVPLDFAQALDWWRRAAAQHYGPAELNLGLANANGRVAPKNLAQATDWMVRAADDGEQAATNWLSNNINNPAVATHNFAFAGAATSTGWIPFEFYDNDQIFFAVQVNGHPAIAFLDTGASSSVVDASYARSIGLTPVGGALQAAGANGTASAALYSPVSIRVGALTLSDRFLFSVDLAPLARLDDHAVALVLGGEVFGELVVDIDFAHRRLAFRAPSAVGAPSGATVVPVRADGANWMTPLSIEGAASRRRVRHGRRGRGRSLPGLR